MKYKLLTFEEMASCLHRYGASMAINELQERRWFTKSAAEKYLNKFGWTKDEFLTFYQFGDNHKLYRSGDTK